MYAVDDHHHLNKTLITTSGAVDVQDAQKITGMTPNRILPLLRKNMGINTVLWTNILVATIT